MGGNRTRRKRAAPSSSEDGGEDEMNTDDEPRRQVREPTGNSRRDELEVDTSDPVIAGLRTSMDNLVQLVKDILPTCYTDDKKSEAVNRLKTCMMKLVRSELNYIEGIKFVARTADTMADIGEDADDHAILAYCEQLQTTALGKVNAHRNSLKDATLKKHSSFARLLKEIRDVTNETHRASQEGDSEEEEEDDEVADLEDDGGEMIPITDPITKLPLTDPVRNKYCKHIYGKTSIMQMIRGGNKTRCPTVGCSNKRWISERHLQQDEELVTKIQKRMREAQKARGNAQQENAYDV